MNPEGETTAEPPATPPGAGQPVETSYELCLLAMARAVLATGIYGPHHPIAAAAADEWLALLEPLLHSRGTFVLGVDGGAAVVNGTAVTSSSPVLHSLLGRLLASRAGQLELLTGFGAEAARSIAECLANADANRVADEEHSLAAWVERHQLRHVRVVRLKWRHVLEGERVVGGVRGAPPRVAADGPPALPGKDEAEKATAWARAFREASEKTDRPVQVPQEVRNAIASYLRGVAMAQPADMAAVIGRAAKNPEQLAEVMLKTALVQQELSRRTDGPVGEDVVACLRQMLDALLQLPETRTDEGWADLSRTLSALEGYVLHHLEALAGGGKRDEGIVRAGFRAMQHELEGAALKREYERALAALQQVERRIHAFFGETGAPPAASP